MIMADEIYEKILLTMREDHHAATFAGDDVLCLTFGLIEAPTGSAATAPAGAMSRAEAPGRGLLGLTCCPTCGCAQACRRSAIRPRSAAYQSINELIVPGGRFEQAKLSPPGCSTDPGVSCASSR